MSDDEKFFLIGIILIVLVITMVVTILFQEYKSNVETCERLDEGYYGMENCDNFHGESCDFKCKYIQDGETIVKEVK